MRPNSPPRSARPLVLLIFGLVLLTVFVARLLDLQVRQHEHFLSQADDNRYYDVRVSPRRGGMTDRFGLDLTQATQVFWQKNEQKSLFVPDTRLDREQALPLLATNSSALRVEYGRWYPLAENLAQTIGYVGKPSGADLETIPDILPTQLLGKTGLERSFDQSLRGQISRDRFELTAFGVPIRLVRSTDQEGGRPLATTLDSILSQRVSQLLGDAKGAVVILDGDTGEVLSLVSHPSYDPNLFLTQDSLSPEEKQARSRMVSQWLVDPDKPLINRAIAGMYPPGSVFKLATALAALKTQAVDATTEVVDEGVLKVGDFNYANWYFSQYGRTDGAISLRRAVAHSNDIYFYKAAEWTGPDQLAAMARQLGYGQPTGIELPGEVSGLIPDPAWKEKSVREKWFLGNTYHMGIGQGDVLVTPLQVASVTQAILHEGQKCRPHLISTQDNTCESVGLDQEQVDLVIDGMVDACSPGGTGVPFFGWNQLRQEQTQTEGLAAYKAGSVACKTGTAEFGGVDAQGRRRTHGWFTMGVHVPELNQLISQEATESGNLSASSDSLTTDATDSASLQRRWLEAAKQRGYPHHLIMTVLVESDEAQPFKEGSREAAPIAFELLQWLVGQDTT